MYSKYEINNKTIYVNKKNGDFSYYTEILDKNTFEVDETQINAKNINVTFSILCINITNQCNLRCDYCFNYNKGNNVLKIDEIKFGIEKFIEKYSNVDKYFIDLSGKGEPLLELDLIIEINHYCQSVSNKVNKEILVTFVSNGTLLTKEIVEILQKERILFGVSLDGTKKNHDLHRKTKSNKPTYNLIMKNIKKIENSEYIGCALTITNNVFNLKKTLIQLNKVFKTISVKPARSCDYALDQYSIEDWKNEYSKLADYLLTRVLKYHDMNLLFALVNGDDYFGKFIKRSFEARRVISRCDACISRLTLNDDNTLYPCPAASLYENLSLGKIEDFNQNKIDFLKNKQISKVNCKNCAFKYLCGGECLIELELLKENNFIMCEYKKHLILLSMYLHQEIFYNSIDEFIKIRNFCLSTEIRYRKDEELYEFLSKEKDLSFIEGKQRFDEFYKKY